MPLPLPRRQRLRELRIDARERPRECPSERRHGPAETDREANVDLETDIERIGEPSGQAGQGLAEYALILALIAIVAIVALLFLGTAISSIIHNIATQM